MLEEKKGKPYGHWSIIVAFNRSANCRVSPVIGTFPIINRLILDC